jgi:putative membrane protein
MADNPNRARDHLANERTFLAWVRTGVATIVFGFAVGRFSIAIRELLQASGKSPTTPGITAWLGMIATVGGVFLILAGLSRYKRTSAQLETDTFEPAGFVIDVVSYLLGLFGLVLAGYLAYIELYNR